MAVFPSLPGIEITVIDAEGKPFEEYDDNDAQGEQDGGVKDMSNANSTESKKTLEYSATDSVHRYIEARTDQEFGLRCTVKPPFVPNCPTIGFVIQIDGVFACEPIFTFNKKKFENATDIMGIPEGKEERPFKFSKISASSESALLDSVTGETKSISDLGTIVISVWREDRARKVPPRSSHNSAFDTPLELHEKDLKGLTTSHSTLLGDSRKVSKARTVFANKLDDSPLAKVTFKYRSKDALKQLLIVSRTPKLSPEPELALHPKREATMDDLDEATRRTVNELIQKLANPGTATAAKIKLEHNSSARTKRETDEGSPTKIKHETDEGSPTKIKREIDEGSPTKIKHEIDEGSPTKIKREIDEGSPTKIKHEREEDVSVESSSRKRTKILGDKVTISLSVDEGVDGHALSTGKDMGEKIFIDLTDD